MFNRQGNYFFERFSAKMTTGVGCVLLAMLSVTVQANYSQRSDTQAFKQKMQREHGFSSEYMDAVLAQANYKDSIVRIMTPKPKPVDSNKPSYVPWKTYKKRFINNTRISQGSQFWSENKAALARAEREFGVPAEIIVAIIGVETSYGRIMGNFKVLDALATLSFDSPRRNEYFQSELAEFLILTREQNLAVTSLKGSYAGAMGYGQFMPSSYRSYAVDFDGDKRVDIWNNPVDAIGSVAHYFKQHGWREGHPVVVRALTAQRFDPSGANQTREPNTSVGALKRLGFNPVDARLPAAEPVTLVELNGDYGKEYWLGLNNFYVITEYNHSRRYALAVYQLAQLIKARHNGNTQNF